MADDARDARVGDHRRGEHRVGRATAARPAGRLGPAEVGERVDGDGHQRGRQRHGEHELAQRQVPGLLQHLLLYLEPVSEQDQHQRDDRQALDEVRVRIEVEQLQAALAEHEAGNHEGRRERQEAALGEPREQRAGHQQHAEHGGRLLQEVHAGGDGGHAAGSYLAGCVRRALATSAALAVVFPAAAAAAAPPRAQMLSQGWEVRGQQAAPAPPQPAPARGGAARGRAATPGATARPGRAARRSTPAGAPITVPSVFNPKAVAAEYAGQVRRYRLRFTGPRTPRGFRWLIEFESVRRSRDRLPQRAPAGPQRRPLHALHPRGPRAAARARATSCVVVVDSRKDPRLPEGWWNWGGIVRPVRLIPAGPRPPAATSGRCRRCGAAARRRGCRAELLVDGVLQRSGAGELASKLEVELRAPCGRVTRRTLPPAAPAAPSGGACACRCGCRPRSSGSRRTRSSTRPGSRCATAARSSRSSGAGSACAR